MGRYEAFARRYDEWSSNMTADIPFYVELAKGADGPLVELAIGNGRVAIPVAQATGKPVVGFDTSPAMLQQARDRATEAGVQLDLYETDMREFTLDEPAALIYCPFRALLHYRRGPTGAGRSIGWQPRSSQAGASPGTHLPSTIRSPPSSTGNTKRNPSRI